MAITTELLKLGEREVLIYRSADWKWRSADGNSTVSVGFLENNVLLATLTGDMTVESVIHSFAILDSALVEFGRPGETTLLCDVRKSLPPSLDALRCLRAKIDEDSARFKFIIHVGRPFVRLLINAMRLMQPSGGSKSYSTPSMEEALNLIESQPSSPPGQKRSIAPPPPPPVSEWVSSDEATWIEFSVLENMTILLQHVGPFTLESAKHTTSTLLSIIQKQGSGEGYQLIVDRRQSGEPSFETLHHIKKFFNNRYPLFETVYVVGPFEHVVQSIQTVGDKIKYQLRFSPSLRHAIDKTQPQDLSLPLEATEYQVDLIETGSHAEQLKLQIDVNPAMVLNIDAFCETHQISRITLWESFRRRFSVSPKQYHTSKRLEHATKLLSKGHQIATVAEQLGFSDSSHFSRTFKKYYDQSPREFQKSSHHPEPAATSP